jgi:hypothetical protein
MSSKSAIWIGMFIDSTLGGFIPELWGAGFLSFSFILSTAVFGILGIYLGFRMSN